MEGRPILSILFISWWYGEYFVKFLRYLERFFVYLFDLFSIEICLKTLFAEWRRDKIDYHGLSLQQRFQAWTLNLASRFIGMIVKLATIATYLIVIFIFIPLALGAIIFWLGLPLIIATLILYGIKIWGVS